jgi:hypothetical protein
MSPLRPDYNVATARSVSAMLAGFNTAFCAPSTCVLSNINMLWMRTTVKDCGAPGQPSSRLERSGSRGPELTARANDSREEVHETGCYPGLQTQVRSVECLLVSAASCTVDHSALCFCGPGSCLTALADCCVLHSAVLRGAGRLNKKTASHLALHHILDSNGALELKYGNHQK